MGQASRLPYTDPWPGLVTRRYGRRGRLLYTTRPRGGSQPFDRIAITAVKLQRRIGEIQVAADREEQRGRDEPKRPPRLLLMRLLSARRQCSRLLHASSSEDARRPAAMTRQPSANRTAAAVRHSAESATWFAADRSPAADSANDWPDRIVTRSGCRTGRSCLMLLGASCRTRGRRRIASRQGDRDSPAVGPRRNRHSCSQVD